jgi:hypothetical protein
MQDLKFHCGDYEEWRFLGCLRTANVFPSSPIFVTLMMQTPSSSETLVITRTTRRNIPEVAIQSIQLIASVLYSPGLYLHLEDGGSMFPPIAHEMTFRTSNPTHVSLAL